MGAPFAYYGGKSRLADRLVGLLPPHRTYIEPFFGSGAVLFSKPPATHEIVNDADGAVVAFFRMLRDRPVELERACRLSPHSRDEFASADLDADGRVDELERARRFWVRVNQSFAKTAGRQTGWSVTTSRTQSVPQSVAGRMDRFGRCAERLMRVSIEHCDAADLVDRLATPDAVVYCDPPYLASTRVARKDRGVANDYRTDFGTETDHRRLAEALRATSARVMLSGYPSPIYDELYGDWWSTRYQVTSHTSDSRRAKRTGRTEVVWANYTPHLGQFDFEMAVS